MSTSVALTKSPDHEKHRKYDRQLRLWGDHGQSFLESAQICLINASATGTEILKSIVLPGVGGFTIVDGEKVSCEEVGNNFFLSTEAIGESRAQIATQMLRELNPDVLGDFIDESPEQILHSNPSFFNNFSVVIATNLKETTLLNLGSMLWEQNVPLIICQTFGMIGYMRIQLKEHNVIESHPDNAHEDLRLDHPFPKLLEYIQTVDLESMNKKDHGHTPYLIILLKKLIEWRKQHDGKPPQNYNEKKQFREEIRSSIWKNENDIPEDEENFEEALKAVNTALIKSTIPENVKNILDDSACLNLSHDSNSFWILCRALKDFTQTEGNGLLPLRGTLPDMFSDSERYIQLQNMYRDEASNQAEFISKRVDELLIDVGRSPGSISDSEIKLFCKNSHFLKVIRGSSIKDEIESSTIKLKELAQNFDDPDDDLIYYVLLRAANRFYVDYSRFPGCYDDQFESDIVKLKSIVTKLLQEWNCSFYAKDDQIHEMCRFGGYEVPSVASFLGGCAAHEVIKLLTKQYVPFDNTYIYNAINCTSSVYEL